MTLGPIYIFFRRKFQNGFSTTQPSVHFYKRGTIAARIEMANLDKGRLWFTHDPLKEHLLFDSSCRQNSDYITTKYLIKLK